MTIFRLWTPLAWLSAAVGDLRARRSLSAVFDQVLRAITGQGLSSRTLRAYTEEWLALRKGEVAPATFRKYEDTTKALLASLGPKSGLDLSAVRREDIARFRDEMGKAKAAGTANVALKIARMIFRQANRDGLTLRDESAGVGLLKASNDGERRPFSEEELGRLLAACDAEWRSMVLFGLYTGARLGDIATLTWQHLDPANGTLTFRTAKTRRAISLPIPEPLMRHIATLPASDDPKAPVHARAAELFRREGRTSTLSREFGELLGSIGLSAKRTHKAADDSAKGRTAKRTVSNLSFHCLRHTAVSMLKNSGAPEVVVRDIVGHENAAISRHYTTINDASKRAALAGMPDVTKG